MSAANHSQGWIKRSNITNLIIKQNQSPKKSEPFNFGDPESDVRRSLVIKVAKNT
jgi:hypothetical protein